MIEPVALAERVEAWQQKLWQLGVAHWRIKAVTLTDQVPRQAVRGDSPPVAGVIVSSDYDTVHFFFANDYLEELEEGGLYPDPDRELDETILHEWLHVAMRDFDEQLERVENWMPDATYGDFHDTLNHSREKLVDRLSRQLYSFYAHDTRRTGTIVPHVEELAASAHRECGCKERREVEPAIPIQGRPGSQPPA